MLRTSEDSAKPNDVLPLSCNIQFQLVHPFLIEHYGPFGAVHFDPNPILSTMRDAARCQHPAGSVPESNQSVRNIIILHLVANGRVGNLGASLMDRLVQRSQLSNRAQD